MTIQTPDDRLETDSFNIADRKVWKLLQRLKEKQVCPCCAARAMAYHAAWLAEQQTGSAEAIEMLEGIIAALREHDVPAPEPMPSTETH